MEVSTSNSLAFALHVVHANSDIAITAWCYCGWRMSKWADTILMRTGIAHEITANLKKIEDVMYYTTLQSACIGAH